jgi:hypothetical protein
MLFAINEFFLQFSFSEKAGEFQLYVIDKSFSKKREGDCNYKKGRETAIIRGNI